jgi:glutathione peroxidase-family protein
MSKVDVNGPNTHDVFKFLKSSAPERGADITWNFGAYWVVDKAGKVLKRAEGITY